MATAQITFDQDSYGPGETIGFTVSVDVPMESSVTVHGTVETPAGDELQADATTTVHGAFGPFTADGYTITQDADDPSKFTATPAA